eukprot:TRINITY_DN712_c0_g1_i10.p1 TRINITY_DN712_c0_g1~~TRINITY_DN712_c0_g1_i10.p1  ORF type:complete len:153 (-),score=35.92 TRINITY_DN712_c0_g1_i10:126-584(-)
METQRAEYVISSSPNAVTYGSDICHFYNTPGGCFKGTSCRYRHVRYADVAGYAVQPPVFFVPSPMYDETDHVYTYGSGYVSPPPYFEPVLNEDDQSDEAKPNNDELVGWLHYYGEVPVPEEGYGITEEQLHALMMSHTAAVHQYYQQQHQQN